MGIQIPPGNTPSAPGDTAAKSLTAHDLLERGPASPSGTNPYDVVMAHVVPGANIGDATLNAIGNIADIPLAGSKAAAVRVAQMTSRTQGIGDYVPLIGNSINQNGFSLS
jgi:hypothetical protein